MYLETYNASYAIEVPNEVYNTIEKLKYSIINYASAFENNDIDDLSFNEDNILVFNTLNNKAMVYIGINTIYPKEKLEICIRNTKKNKVLYIYVDFFELKYPETIVNKVVDYIRDYVDNIK